MARDLMAGVRNGEEFTLRQQIALTLQLSVPAILAQLSTTLMQYIDAAMVGSLGADASAAVGVVSTSVWLFNGLCYSSVTGFTVQVAQRLGAKDEVTARDLLRHSLLVCLIISTLLGYVGSAISPSLPGWLGSKTNIHAEAAAYFRIIALGLPSLMAMDLFSGMLQASGNMKTPSMFMILSCFLDVVYNFFLIFPTRQIFGLTVPGAGMGVSGAALGTVLSHVTAAICLAVALLWRSPSLHLRRSERFRLSGRHLARWWKLTIPLAMERAVMSGAQVISTSIVAPMGNIPVAAHSFALTVEALCYMPSYGVGRAAATLVGQSIGARRRDLAVRLGYVTVATSMIVMVLSAAVVYVTCPWILGLLTPSQDAIDLAVAVLRTIAVVEPFFSASVVATNVMQGAGSTLRPTLMNFFSMWCVRIPLYYLIAPHYGLRGMWFVMSCEVAARGIAFLIVLVRKRWLPKDMRLTA